jgi:hypothetical protein
MHELSRHVIHSCETLAIASDTLEAMLRDHEAHRQKTRDSAYSYSSLQSEQTSKTLQFYSSFLTNLKMRAQSFHERLQTEIQLVNLPLIPSGSFS